MIPTRGKNDKKIKFFIAALALAFKKFFRPFLIFLRSLMPKKSTSMQKSHIRVVFHHLWLFGHFWPIQITVSMPLLLQLHQLKTQWGKCLIIHVYYDLNCTPPHFPPFRIVRKIGWKYWIYPLQARKRIELLIRGWKLRSNAGTTK